MMQKNVWIPIVIMLTVIAGGCSDSPRKLTGNIEGVSYTWDGSEDGLKEVTRQASNECQNFGRIAVLAGTSQTDDGYLATFNCAHSR